MIRQLVVLALVLAPTHHGGPHSGLTSQLRSGSVTAGGVNWDLPSSRLQKRPSTGTVSPYEFRSRAACGGGFGAGVAAGALDSRICAAGLVNCFAQGRSNTGINNQVDRRLRGSDGTWQDAGYFCGSDPVTGQPAIPTRAQIEQAFLELPFAKPTVSVQPRGNVTLVNLPTYYQVHWPEAGLAPGDISEPVQLLSWSIEFRIKIDSYTYSFGDGTTSEPTTDPGGTYPDGAIRHSYTATRKDAAVKVDAQLTGDFRVNGGAWQPLTGVADLQDEPVTTLQVKQARTRLIG